MRKVIKESLRVSFLKTWIYRFESLMLLLHVAFELVFLLVFWVSVTQTFYLPKGYQAMDLYLYSGLMMLASAVQEFFFAVNVLPYIINTGELDKYLVRPLNPWWHIILDQVNMVGVLEKFVLAVIFTGFIWVKGAYRIALGRSLIAFILLFLGTLAIVAVYFLLSLSSFWLGLSENFRSILFTIQDVQRYPLGFFAKWVRAIFLVIFPVGLVTYYPFELLLGHVELDVKVFLNYALVLGVLVFACITVAKRGLKRYESNN